MLNNANASRTLWGYLQWGGGRNLLSPHYWHSYFTRKLKTWVGIVHLIESATQLAVSLLR